MILKYEKSINRRKSTVWITDVIFLDVEAEDNASVYRLYYVSGKGSITKGLTVEDVDMVLLMDDNGGQKQYWIHRCE